MGRSFKGIALAGCFLGLVPCAGRLPGFVPYAGPLPPGPLKERGGEWILLR